MRRALVTGAAGQDGLYLTELLLSKEYQVFAVPGPASDSYSAWAKAQGSQLHTLYADITDADSLQDAVREALPDEVYNLAGLSSVGASWQQAVGVAEVNALGVVRLLEALREHKPEAAFCQASSADIFGVPASSPQNEQTPVAPVSPYGASKAYAHFITRCYRMSYQMHACNAILYNHESPRRPESFVVRKITRGAAAIKLGQQTELHLGNLDVKRDWGFAPDYVEGMWLMLQAEKPDDYVLATGVAHSVRDVCRVAFGHLGLDYERYVTVDTSLMRPVESAELSGDSSKARELLGWQPRVAFDEMVQAMVDHDMADLQQSQAG